MEEIRTKLKAVILEAFQIEVEPVVTEAPRNIADDLRADYSTNVAMVMAKQVGKSPREIAEKITEFLKRDNFPFDVEVAGPGFLNFISRDEYWKSVLAEYGRDFDKKISQDVYSGKTVICEFSDPNPFKVLHVGHLYTSVVGDAISRIVEFAGGKVIRANFGGDVGLHVAKTIYAVMRDNKTTDDIETIAECYVEGARAYEEDEQAHTEITRLNKMIYQIAESAEKTYSDPEMTRVAELYWKGREVSYQYFEEFYQKIGVKFDKYYPESKVASRGLAEVRAHTPEVYEESDGAIVYKGEKDGLHTRVFINKEGLPTYEAKDVGLIFAKWDDYHFDKSVVITGNDIIDYMKVVLTSISKYAPELVEKTQHITHGNVRLPGNEKMSSRKGNFVKAVDVLNGVEALVSEAAAGKVSAVALGAIKYAFLKYKIGGNFDFDMKESVSTTGNSGVYLQYSAVRAKKILKNQTAESSRKDEWELNEYEKKLIQKMARYERALAEVVADLVPHKLTNFLYELAQEFSRFYEHVKVAGSEYEAQRMEIVGLYLKIMLHGLFLLGIEVPEEM